MKGWCTFCGKSDHAEAQCPTVGVPALDATKPCILKTADPTRTYCERCKNPHHGCDHGMPDGVTVSGDHTSGGHTPLVPGKAGR